MSTLWRDVFVPADVVASDGFTAKVGGVVSMSLELYCRYRLAAAEHDRSMPVRSETRDYPQADQRHVYDLVGTAVAVESCIWSDGWVLDVDGLFMYVSEAPARPVSGVPVSSVHRDPGSDPAAPGPPAGSRVRVRGQLSIAESYVTSGFEPEIELSRRAVRPWRVRRIVRLDSEFGGSGAPVRGRGQAALAVRRGDLRLQDAWRTTGFLLDLEPPDGSADL